MFSAQHRWLAGLAHDGTSGPLRITAQCLDWQVSGYG